SCPLIRASCHLIQDSLSARMTSAASKMFMLCVSVSLLFDEELKSSPGRRPGTWERASPKVPIFVAACPRVKAGQEGLVTKPGPSEVGSGTTGPLAAFETLAGAARFEIVFGRGWACADEATKFKLISPPATILVISLAKGNIVVSPG